MIAGRCFQRSRIQSLLILLKPAFHRYNLFQIMDILQIQFYGNYLASDSRFGTPFFQRCLLLFRRAAEETETRLLKK